MYARIATFEGANPAGLDQMIEGVKGQVDEQWASPPEGLEQAREMMMLVDREHGRGLGITLFETEADLRRGDEALNRMSPAGGGEGERTGVAFYEIPIRKAR